MFARLMGLRVVTPSRLHELVQQGGVTVIDVNAPQSWQAARVRGAVNLDPGRFFGSDLPPDLASPLVFYCSNVWCRKAPQAARRAEALGYRDVQVMSAGIKGWLDEGLPTESGAR